MPDAWEVTLRMGILGNDVSYLISNREHDTDTCKYPLMQLLDGTSSTEWFGWFSTKTQSSNPRCVFQTDRQVPIQIPIIPVIGSNKNDST